jgi:transposase-like protein
MQLTTTMTDEIKTKSRRRTPWTGVTDVTPPQAFVEDCTREAYEDRHPSIKESQEVDFLNQLKPKACGHCRSTNFVKRGLTSNGIQRYKCLDCGKSFNVLTGTLFDSHKIPITEWLGFLLDIFGYGSFGLTSKGNRNSINTTRYWIEKVFLVLEHSQDEIMLEDTVWIDEKFYRVRASDVQTHPSGLQYRGISRNQMCIGVATDGKKVLCIYEGLGKTNNSKTLASFESHIKPGSKLIHDKEKCHNVLVEKLNLESEAYDSKDLKKLPDRDNPLNKINKICNLLQQFLHAHSGFNRSKMQDYLNLFCFIMNPPENKYEKLVKFIEMGITLPKILRFRD